MKCEVVCYKQNGMKLANCLDSVHSEPYWYLNQGFLWIFFFFFKFSLIEFFWSRGILVISMSVASMTIFVCHSFFLVYLSNFEIESNDKITEIYFKQMH